MTYTLYFLDVQYYKTLYEDQIIYCQITEVLPNTLQFYKVSSRTHMPCEKCII